MYLVKQPFLYTLSLNYVNVLLSCTIILLSTCSLNFYTSCIYILMRTKCLVTRAIDAGYKYSRDAQLQTNADYFGLWLLYYTSPKRPLWIMNPVSFCVMVSVAKIIITF